MNQKSSQSQSQAQNKGDGNVANQSQSQSQQSQSVKAPDADSNSSTATPAKESSPKSEKKAKSFDELQISKGQYRPVAQAVGSWLDNINMDALNYLNEQAENIFYRKGVTFTVYSDAKNIERMIPFDIIPRIIAASEWQHIEAGCAEKIKEAFTW